jgi:16S rRNA (adenine1518-N6/adenine1519-N6)-dimethyltransferase
MTGEMMTMRPEQLSIRQFVELTNLTETELKRVCLIQENL